MLLQHQPKMKDNTPLVSIIVPTNRRISYLNKCLESILEQTYTHYEVLIISDGEDKKTEQLVSKYLTDKRVHFFEFRKTGLPAAIRNFGLTKAKGDYIAFCDDDDMWTNNKLAEQIKCCTDNNVDICFTLSNRINAEGFIIKNTLYYKIRNICDFLCHTCDFYLLFSNFVTLSSLIVRADSMHKFDESPEFRGSEDYDLMIKMLHQSRYYFIKEKLVFYRIHDDNLSGDTPSAYKRAIKIFEQSTVTKKYGYFVVALAKLHLQFRIWMYK